MNERIKQLAEQAVEETHSLMIMEYKNFESKLYEKFAELIVKKCADIATNRYQRLMDGGKAIKEHFGVE